MNLVTLPVRRIVALRINGKIVLRRVVVGYRYFQDGEEVSLTGGPPPSPPVADPLRLRLRYFWQNFRHVFWGIFWTVVPWYVWVWITATP